MKQYCRYCANLYTGNDIYCAARDVELSEAKTKRVNHCKYFEFCSVDAYNADQTYKPRKIKNKEQFENLTLPLQLVKTGGNKRGFLKSERKLGEAEITALKRAWRNLYANNTESVVVLNNGLDFKEAASTSVEMQLNESVKSLQEQIHDI